MIRAFVAIPLPDHICEHLEKLSLNLPLPRPVPPENMHLTLAFLGEVAAPILEDVHNNLAEIRTASFPLTLRGVEHFGGSKPRVVYAGVAPEPLLDRLHAKVKTATKFAGVTPQARKFMPHITLGRYHQGEADLPRLECALIEHAGFSLPSIEVDNFVLYCSHLGRSGPFHEELASYSLHNVDKATIA